MKFTLGEDFTSKKFINGDNKICNFKIHLNFMKLNNHWDGYGYDNSYKYGIKLFINIVNKNGEEIFDLMFNAIIDIRDKENEGSKENKKIRLKDENSSITITKNSIITRNENNVYNYNKFILNDEEIFNGIRNIFIKIM